VGGLKERYHGGKPSCVWENNIKVGLVFGVQAVSFFNLAVGLNRL
jgi:hypothetical protein